LIFKSLNKYTKNEYGSKGKFYCPFLIFVVNKFMNLNLKNKYALVCGSTQGIGKATAIALALEGAHVTLAARNEEKLKLVISELPNPENHTYIVADFSNPEDLHFKVVSFIQKSHG